jgi:transposase
MPLAKRQEILAAFDGAGMSAARFTAMVGINYSTFCSWVQERNQKQGTDSVLTGAAAKPKVQWIEAEIACGASHAVLATGRKSNSLVVERG